MPNSKEKGDWLHIIDGILIFRKGKSTRLVNKIA